MRIDFNLTHSKAKPHCCVLRYPLLDTGTQDTTLFLRAKTKIKNFTNNKVYELKIISLGLPF